MDQKVVMNQFQNNCDLRELSDVMIDSVLELKKGKQKKVNEIVSRLAGDAKRRIEKQIGIEILKDMSNNTEM